MICPASLYVWVKELREIRLSIEELNRKCKYESTSLLLGGIHNNLHSAEARLENLIARFGVVKDL